MSIAGTRLAANAGSHYSHIRLDAKRKALDALSGGVAGGLRPKSRPKIWGYFPKSLKRMAGPTRLELATSCVTGRRSNRLNYGPVFAIHSLMGKSQYNAVACCAYVARFAGRACNGICP